MWQLHYSCTAVKMYRKWQRLKVRRPNMYESGSSGDVRSIYQQRAGRAGGCSTALRCPGADASVHSYLRRDPRRSRVQIRRCRDSALGSVTTTWLLPFYISWNRRLNGRWKVKLPWPTVREILYLIECGKWWSYQQFIGLETSAIPVSVIY
jgi:hypothetical protein